MCRCITSPYSVYFDGSTAIPVSASRSNKRQLLLRGFGKDQVFEVLGSGAVLFGSRTRARIRDMRNLYTTSPLSNGFDDDLFLAAESEGDAYTIRTSDRR